MHRRPGTATWPASGPAFAHLPGVSVWRGPAGSLRGYRVADIFDEVQEDLRAERMNRLLARYGGLFLGVMLLVVAGVAGMQGWRWWQARTAAQAAERYLAVNKAAAEPGADGKAAADSFAGIAAEAPPGYRTLARLRAAALKAEAGDRPGALALWEEVARDGAAEPLYRDLATADVGPAFGRRRRPGGDRGPAGAARRGALAGLGAGGAGAGRHPARRRPEAARTLLTALAADAAAPQGAARPGRQIAGGAWQLMRENGVRRLTRRAALLGGVGLLGRLRFPAPNLRFPGSASARSRCGANGVPVLTAERPLGVDEDNQAPVTLPPPALNAEWAAGRRRHRPCAGPSGARPAAAARPGGPRSAPARPIAAG